jgi:hypothetical protein
MSNVAVRELVDNLRARGLVPADAPVPPADGMDRPWFISLLQGLAGWLAGVFLLVFVGMMFEPQRTAAIFIIGFSLLGAAWTIYHFDRDAVFFDQFALALSIAGQVAVAWGIVKDDPSELVVAVTLLLLQLAIILVMPNRLARSLAALFATLAWVHVVRYVLSFDDRGGLLVAVEWSLRWGPLLALAIWLIRRETAWMATGLRDHARPILTGLLLGLAVGGLADPRSWFSMPGDAIGVAFNGWALLPLLSIALSLGAAYGAFRLRSVGLLGFAIVASLAHLSRFYYLYGTTLLVKSVLMACVGVSMVALALWLRRDRRRDA